MQTIGTNEILKCDSQYEEQGPLCIRPLYKSQFDDEHAVVGPIYQRPQLMCEYDHLLFHDEIAQSERLRILKPEVVLRLLGERQKYAYLKKFAVEHLQENVNEQLAILYNLCKCEKDHQEPNAKLANNVFSWFMEDFLKRRLLQDFVWLDVLQRTSELCLNIFKFKQDLEQLNNILRFIFEGLLSNMGNEEIDIYAHIVKPLNNAKQLLEISQNMEQDLKQNNRLLNELLLKDSVVANIKRYSEQEMIKIYLEAKILNRNIWGPIEVRYQLQWYNSKVQQYHYRLQNMQESRQCEIDHFQIKTANENCVTTSCMDFYYSTLESLKSRLNQWQEKFDIDYEEAENRIAYKRVRNEKMREQRKFLAEEILRFHKEIEMMRIREERETKQMERRRLEEEALALKKIQRKPKKKGKKPGTSNTGKASVMSKGPKKIPKK